MGLVNLGGGSYQDYQAWTQTAAGKQSAANHQAKYGDQSQSKMPVVWQPPQNWQQQLSQERSRQQGAPVAGATAAAQDMSAYATGRAQPIQSSQGTPYGRTDFQQMFSPSGIGQMFNFQGFSPAPAPPRPAAPPMPTVPYYGREYFLSGERSPPQMISPDFDFDEGARVQARSNDNPLYQQLQQRRQFDPWSGQLPNGLDAFTANSQGYSGENIQAVSQRAAYNQRAAAAESERWNAQQARIQEEERARTQQMRDQYFAGPLAEREQALAAQEAEYQQRLQRRQGVTPAFSFTIPPAVSSPADLPPDQRPPAFTQTFTDPFGNETKNNLMAQREALIQRINEQSLPYYMGQSGRFAPNLQELWGQAGNMVRSGWTNPLTGLFG